MDDQTQILILGGTGAMGKNLVGVLKQQDNLRIVVTSRQKYKDTGNVYYRQGNAHDIEWLSHILQEREWDAIVDFMVYTTEEFKYRASKLLDATKQYVYISSARVYADSGQDLITEESPRLLDVSQDKEYLQTDEYALAKARQENVLINNEQKNWTIIRPYITFSDNRLQFGVVEKEQWLIPALNHRPIVFSKDIAEHYTTMTDGMVVAKCIAALLTNPKAKGEIFHIASNESHRWQDILKWYIDVIQEETCIMPKVYYTNEWDFRLGGGKYQLIYDRLCSRRFDNSKICKFVSPETFEPVEECLKRAIKTFIRDYQSNETDLNQDLEYTRGIITNDFLPIRKIRGRKRKIKVIAYKMHIYKFLKYIYHLWN